MDTIKINGVEYRVEVNWRVLCSFLEYKECNDMSCFNNMSVKDYSALLALSIEEGERQEGRSVDAAEIVMTMPVSDASQVIARFMEIYVSQATPKTSGEPKKD